MNMMSLFKLIIRAAYLCCIGLNAVVAFAQSDFTEQAHSAVKFVSEHQVMYAGEKYYLGLDIKLDPKWHTYWINPGDSASASIFNFKPIKGVQIGEPLYPTPQRYPVGPLYSFGYEDRVLIQFPVEISPKLSQRQLTFELSAEWLVCQEECIPGIYNFKLTLPAPPPMDIYSETEKQHIKDSTLNEEYRTLFETTRKSWPQETLTATVDLTDTHTTLAFPTIPHLIDIFPYPGLNISSTPPTPLDSGSLQQSRYQFKNTNHSIENTSWQFLASFKDQDGILKSYILSSTTRTSDGGSSIWLMMLFGLLGGLILNLMPCVFPILMLKVFQVMQSHQEKNIRTSLLFYVLGILVSFWILSITILILQSAGSFVGWGFQLQSPVFTSFLILLFILMAFYFLDFFSLPQFRFLNMGQGLSKRQDNIGAFFTGVLAVIVASPCTAPFMGAAMGYALSRSTFEVLAIFTSLGLGLGLPFLLLSLFPRSLSWLPHPGTWMIYFKKVMAVPLLLTALWLAWVLMQQLSPQNAQDDGFWTPYSKERVAEQRKSQPVFVNFTAAWCISCKVNEKVAFQDAEVQKFIEGHKIKMFKADWTQKNPEIAKVLQSYGRAGVPMYLFFTPESSEPVLLPEVLTPQILIQHLKTHLRRE